MTISKSSTLRKKKVNNMSPWYLIKLYLAFSFLKDLVSGKISPLRFLAATFVVLCIAIGPLGWLLLLALSFKCYSDLKQEKAVSTAETKEKIS
jgi:hypothetical protein